MAVGIDHVTELQRLLVKNGFIKSKVKDAGKYITEEIKDSSGKKKKIYKHAKGGQISSDDADVELAEESNMDPSEDPSKTFIQYLPTGYPDPKKRYRLVTETINGSIEEPYFWFLEHLRQDQSFSYVEKVFDISSASEQSSFWGASQSRIGIQQDRVSQYMKGISEMIKQLFQLVRELRVLDEKLLPRTEWMKANSADITLKGEYTDLVENRGGQMQPGSVYHLSQQVGYTILPDLFFNTHVYTLEEIDKKVDELKFNQNVKNVLKRKLYAFVNWKIKTDAELKSRRLFTLRYLRQHWNTIRMYMNWIKPYLRNIARLQMNPNAVDSPDLVSSFETSMTELEIICYKPTKTDYHPVIIATFMFRTRPDLSFQKDQYAHKGPVHVGRVEISLRSYGWKKDQIEAYKNYRKDEDIVLLGMVDDSVKAAMEALGEELEKYLSESGEKEFEDKLKEKEQEEKKKKINQAGAGEPFLAVFQGFGEIFGSLTGDIFSFSKSAAPKPKGKSSDAAGNASGAMWQTYKNFKKAHGMLSW